MAGISGVVDGGSTLPSGIAQPDLPPAEAWGEQPRLATREIPLTERRWSSTLPSPRRPAQLIRATKWFVAGKFDMTFAYSVTEPLRKEVANQRPDAICEL